MDDNAHVQIIPSSLAAACLAPTTVLLAMVLMRLVAIITQKTGARARPTTATTSWTL